MSEGIANDTNDDNESNLLGPDWDPLEPSLLANAAEGYGRLRASAPVAYTDRFGGFWSLFKYRDIVDAARDTATFSSADQRVGSIPSLMTPRLRRPLQSDPPEHTHHRTLLRRLFCAEAMAQFEPKVRGLAVEMLEPLLKEQSVEMVSRFSHPFPARILCAFLGIPDDAWQTIDIMTSGVMTAAVNGDGQALAAANAEVDAYTQSFVEQRRASGDESGADVLSELLKIGELGNEEVADIVFTLLGAGSHSTSRGLGIVLGYLAEHPGLQHELRANPDVIPRVVEEIMRAQSPVQHGSRIVMRDVEVGGQTLRKGDLVALMWISGNRDEEEFPEAAVCKFDRKPPKTLTFGHGIHNCLGAPLARLELKVVVEELLGRTTHIVPDGPFPRMGWPRYGIAQLPLAMTPADEG